MYAVKSPTHARTRAHIENLLSKQNEDKNFFLQFLSLTYFLKQNEDFEPEFTFEAQNLKHFILGPVLSSSGRCYKTFLEEI